MGELIARIVEVVFKIKEIILVGSLCTSFEICIEPLCRLYNKVILTLFKTISKYFLRDLKEY